MLARLASAILVLALAQLLTHAEAREGNLGRLAWAAFTCATYAEMLGNEAEQKRLFGIGVNAGRTFLKGFRDGTLAETARKEAPAEVLTVIGPPDDGQSVDFMLGRIFEKASTEASGSVVKKISGDKDRPVIASFEYLQADCTNIK